MIVAYGYLMEAFFAWYSGNPYERVHDGEPHHGPVRLGLLVPAAVQRGDAAAAVVPRVRRSTVWRCSPISLVVNVGMWLERFVIVVTSLHRDFLPSSWGMYYPTIWDWMTYVGTIGLFLTLLFLFIRFLPMISIFEMRTILPEAEVEGHGGH